MRLPTLLLSIPFLATAIYGLPAEPPAPGTAATPALPDGVSIDKMADPAAPTGQKLRVTVIGIPARGADCIGAQLKLSERGISTPFTDLAWNAAIRKCQVKSIFEIRLPKKPDGTARTGVPLMIYSVYYADPTAKVPADKGSRRIRFIMAEVVPRVGQ